MTSMGGDNRMTALPTKAATDFIRVDDCFDCLDPRPLLKRVFKSSVEGR